jgi:hypothetical protein
MKARFLRHKVDDTKRMREATIQGGHFVAARMKQA